MIKWLKKLLGCKEDELQLEIESLKNRIKILEKMIKGQEYESPICLGVMKNIELLSILKPYCEEIYLSDSIYGLTSTKNAKEYCETTKVAIKEFKKNKFDCDEFSFALMGYWNLDLYQFAFGVAWSKIHAFNIMIDNKKKIWIIEPQSNRFYSIKEIKSNPKYYPFRFILI